MSTEIETVIVGAGQAGLALSYCLTRLGREHLILERGRIAERWRSERWDSFTLLSPRWHSRLPGFHYAGPDPHGFMDRAEVVGHFERYASTFGPRVREGVTVTRVSSLRDTGYQVETDASEPIMARNVVIATGPFQRPHTPAPAGHLSPNITQIHSVQYRNPQQLPSGAVLVVGSGTTGQQIAEELYRNGRQVFLSVGRYARLSRRYRGHDSVWWMDTIGSFDQTVDSAPSAAVRPGAALSGSKDGHDLDLRRFATDGVVLVGHLRGVEGSVISFTDDVAQSIGQAEEVDVAFKREVDAYIERSSVVAPEEAPRPPIPLAETSFQTQLDLRAADVRSVVWATGFRNDLGWIEIPLLDERSEPRHRRGVTPFPGLYVLGLKWLWKRKSSFIDGVGEDAQYLAEHIDSRMRAPLQLQSAP